VAFQDYLVKITEPCGSNFRVGLSDYDIKLYFTILIKQNIASKKKKFHPNGLFSGGAGKLGRRSKKKKDTQSVPFFLNWFSVSEELEY
jgi:hypothetical protein